MTLVNATSQYAAMNLAGPRSREVVESLTAIDLSPDGFPYLGAREGEVAGVRALVLRVGFVGELGYEIHVPAGNAMHVWNALLDAGAGVDIAPFGTEAQRLLRLEKGHLIVGHDTDALTDPYEAGLSALLAAKKPFFVGKRSLEVLDKKPRKRVLVGIRWPEQHTGTLPEECQLIIDGHAIAGRVTSIAHESTLGYPLGMAFVHPDFARPGREVAVRVERDTLTRAIVTPLPHYDPENLRQTELQEAAS